MPSTAIKYVNPKIKSTCKTTMRGRYNIVMCKDLPKSITTITSAPTPKNLSIIDAMVLVKGKISMGNTTFCTNPELLLMLFMPLFMASENARKGSHPQ